jgi:hypothetical protein
MTLPPSATGGSAHSPGRFGRVLTGPASTASRDIAPAE